MRLTTTDVDTPAGPVRLVFSGRALACLSFLDRWEGAERGLVRRFGTLELAGANGESENARARFSAYLDGDLGALSSIEVDPGGTPFQARVWQRLREIPCGETLSYGALAGAIGAPTATRAVAGANAQNPVAIVIPCHRVIAKDGRLWGYAGGLPRKQWLLTHEGAFGPELRC